MVPKRNKLRIDVFAFVDVSTPTAASLRTVGVGETAILECNTDPPKTHNASYKIVWLHNGQILRSDSRRHLAVDGKVLVILQSREEDQGFYTCRLDDYIQSARLAIIGNVHTSFPLFGSYSRNIFR